MANRIGVAILGTGGSISMTLDDSGKRRAALNAQQLTAGVNQAALDAVVATHDLASVASNEMGLQDWVGTVASARDILAHGHAVVVAHGTDSLEDVAFLCSELLAEQPVVFTGAMRPPGSLGADGVRNLSDAIVVAAAAPHTPLVVLDGEVWSAGMVHKRHSTSLQAFGSRIGVSEGVVRDGVYVQTARTRPAAVHPPWPSGGLRMPPVVQMLPGMPADQLDDVMGSSHPAVVVATFGGGSMHPQLRRRVAAAADTKQIVVVSGLPGPVSNEDLYPHALSELQDAGVAIEETLGHRQARLRMALYEAAGLPYAPYWSPPDRSGSIGR